MVLSHKILDVIGCPMCKGRLHYDREAQLLVCKFHKVAFPIEDGVPVMLVAKAQPIISDYKK